jgi:hypothetical protein
LKYESRLKDEVLIWNREMNENENERDFDFNLKLELGQRREKRGLVIL